MLEQGVDRIVAQVVDPKIHHTFRPQVERVVREFMSPGSYVDEPPVPPAPVEEKQDFDLPVQGEIQLNASSRSLICLLSSCLIPGRISFIFAEHNNLCVLFVNVNGIVFENGVLFLFFFFTFVCMTQ